MRNWYQSLLDICFFTKMGGGNEGIERERACLKSVEGSEPCQPMSFHCSDFRGGTSRDGYASLHSFLRESCHHFCKWIIYYIYLETERGERREREIAYILERVIA